MTTTRDKRAAVPAGTTHFHEKLLWSSIDVKAPALWLPTALLVLVAALDTDATTSNWVT
jgi:hypothetical protein